MRPVGSLWLSLIRSTSKQTKNLRALRRVGIWFYSSIVRANIFLPPPRIILIGPPKTGTHLLSDCLSLMPRMMFSGRRLALPKFYAHRKPHNLQFDLSKAPLALDKPGLRRFLGGCPQGMFVTAHARFHPVLQDLLRELRFRQILLLRDPRDVVVSSMFFTKRGPGIQHHKYYAEALKSDQERIMATIRGFGRDVGTDRPRASIGERFEEYTPWLDDPSTLVVRFEDLVGPRGGGDSERQLDEIKRIGDFVERPLSHGEAQQIAQKMYSKGSLTYRKGIVGDWRNYFTEDHRRVFKEVAGDVLIRLGYEKDMDW
jgi:hypothetical protein